MSALPPEPITVPTPEQEARVTAIQAAADADHQHGMEHVLRDAQGTARRLAAEFGISTHADVYGDHCINCDARWALPADKATCPHRPICEDCWPNGCPDCEQAIEDDLRHREAAADRILGGMCEVRVGVDDLNDSDLRALDPARRKDMLHHASEALESLRRLVDTLNAQNARHLT